MKPAGALIPAPKRGLYDRAMSRHERQAAQQERVIAALAMLVRAGRELSVASVVEQAGIGRNTFYEYFDDVEHALTAINSRARGELTARAQAALLVARTPLERLRALARAWVDSLTGNREFALVALRPPPAAKHAADLSELGRCIATILENELESRSALPGLSDPLRIIAVAAVFEAVSKVHLGGSPPPDDLSRILADLAIRLLR